MTSTDLLVMAIIIFGGLALWLAMNMEGPLRFRRKPVLTGGELEFLFRLQRALPDCIVCPEVPVGVLLEPVGVGKIRLAALERIKMQRVGYAVFDKEMELLAVVELDERARPKRHDVARDGWFAGAGIRTVRFRASKPPSDNGIRRSIFTRNEPSFEPSIPKRNPAPAAPLDFQRADTPWRNTVDLNI